MSQEQLDQTDRTQQSSREQGSDIAATPELLNENLGGAKKKIKRVVSEEAISPHPSIWPLGLALAIVVLLIGSVTYVAVMGVGALLVAVAIIGWGLERR